MSKKVEEALASSIPPKVREYIKSIIDPALKDMNTRISQQAEYMEETRRQMQEQASTGNARITNMERMLDLQPKSRAMMQQLIAHFNEDDTNS